MRILIENYFIFGFDYSSIKNQKINKESKTNPKKKTQSKGEFRMTEKSTFNENKYNRIAHPSLKHKFIYPNRNFKCH